MGTLTYDSALKAEFDDRVLAHLQIVILAKLRRAERFAFTWPGDENSVGRTSVWISPNIGLAFEYFDEKPPLISRAWIEALTKTANSAGGLMLVPEPVAAPAPSA